MRLAGKPKPSESNPAIKEATPSITQKPKSFVGPKPVAGAVVNSQKENVSPAPAKPVVLSGLKHSLSKFTMQPKKSLSLLS